MTVNVTLVSLIGVLYAAGVYLLLDRSLTRVLLGILLLGNATNVLLLSAGGPAGGPPLVGTVAEEDMSDPLAQAMILTAIVITMGMAAFLLAVIHRSWLLARGDDVEDDDADREVRDRAEDDIGPHDSERDRDGDGDVDDPYGDDPYRDDVHRDVHRDDSRRGDGHDSEEVTRS